MRVVKITSLIVGIVVLLIFSLIFFGLFRSRFNPIDYLKCLISNGSYEVISVPLGAPPLGYTCVSIFNDGGKKCTSNEECQGNCLITKDTIVQSTGILSSEVVGGFGECEYNDKRFPCYPGDFENAIGGCI